MAGPVNVASAHSLRCCMKAPLFMYWYSCCLGCPEVGSLYMSNSCCWVQYLMKDIWPLGIFLPLELPSHLISRNVLPLKSLQYIWRGDNIIAKLPFIWDQSGIWMETKWCHPLSCIADKGSCTLIAEELPSNVKKNKPKKTQPPSVLGSAVLWIDSLQNCFNVANLFLHY